MSKYIDFFRYYEADRTRFIRNNPNLTEEQKSEIINIFKKYPTIDKDIKWGSNDVNNWGYEQFKPYLNKAGKSISQSKKNKTGIESSGLELGKDYVVLSNNNGVIAYQPLTYYASRIIASNSTPPVVKGKDVEGKDISGAEWCISQQKSRMFWDNHSIKSKESFVIICGEEVPTQKVCLTVSENRMDADNVAYRYSINNLYYNIWDYYDDPDNVTSYTLDSLVDVEDLITKAYNNYHLVLENHNRDVEKTEKIDKEIRYQEEFKKLTYNSETKRYDWNGKNGIILGYLVKNDEFVVPLGVWNGDFLVSSLSITNLKNGPTKVLGNYHLSHCDNLQNLEGCASIIRDDFYCFNCLGLTSLKGISQHIGRNVGCARCFNLKSLEGVPKVVNGNFDCFGCRSLTSLEGGPIKVKGEYSCFRCDNLTSLKGAPKYVGKTFDCSSCNLQTLDGLNMSNIGKLECKNNPGYPFKELEDIK